MGFISGSWENTHVMCGNHNGDYKNEMRLETFGKSLEYVCPCYYEEEREKGAPACNNRIPLKEYEKIKPIYLGIRN